MTDSLSDSSTPSSGFVSSENSFIDLSGHHETENPSYGNALTDNLNRRETGSKAGSHLNPSNGNALTGNLNRRIESNKTHEFGSFPILRKKHSLYRKRSSKVSRNEHLGISDSYEKSLPVRWQPSYASVFEGILERHCERCYRIGLSEETMLERADRDICEFMQSEADRWRKSRTSSNGCLVYTDQMAMLDRVLPDKGYTLVERKIKAKPLREATLPSIEEEDITIPDTEWDRFTRPIRFERNMQQQATPVPSRRTGGLIGRIIGGSAMQEASVLLDKFDQFQRMIETNSGEERDFISNLMIRFEDFALFLEGLRYRQYKLVDCLPVFIAYIKTWRRDFLVMPLLWQAIKSTIEAADSMSQQAAPTWSDDAETAIKQFFSYAFGSLDQVLEVVRNWSKFKDSEIAKNLANFVDILATLKFIYPDEEPAKMTNWFRGNDWQMFRMRVWDVQKNSASFTLMCINTVEFLLTRVCSAYKCGSMAMLWYDNDDMAALDFEYAYLISITELVSAGRLEEVAATSGIDYNVPPVRNVVEYETRLRDFVNNANKLAKGISSCTEYSHLRASVLQKKAKLEKIYNDHLMVLKSAALRERPLSACIFGKTAENKTRFCAISARATLNCMGEPCDIANTVTLNAADKFMSEYQAEHRAIILDDFGNLKAQFCEKAPTQHIIDIINNQPIAAIKADVAEKGKVMIRPAAVFITTNVKELEAYTYSNCAASILRRIDFTATIEVKKEYRLPNGLPDHTKFNAEGAQPQDGWDILIEEPFVVRSANPAIDDKIRYVTPFTNPDGSPRKIGMREYLQYLQNRATKHKAAQSKYVALEQRYWSGKMCPHHPCYPEDGCLECAHEVAKAEEEEKAEDKYWGVDDAADVVSELGDDDSVPSLDTKVSHTSLYGETLQELSSSIKSHGMENQAFPQWAKHKFAKGIHACKDSACSRKSFAVTRPDTPFKEVVTDEPWFAPQKEEDDIPEIEDTVEELEELEDKTKKQLNNAQSALHCNFYAVILFLCSLLSKHGITWQEAKARAPVRPHVSHLQSVLGQVQRRIDRAMDKKTYITFSNVLLGLGATIVGYAVYKLVIDFFKVSAPLIETQVVDLITQSSTVQIPVRGPEDQKTVWAKPVVMPLPVSMESESATFDHVRSLVERNIATAYTGEVNRMRVNILPLRGDLWLMPWHFARLYPSGFSIRSRQTGEGGRSFKVQLTEKDVEQIPDTDYAVVRLARGGSVPNLLKFFPTGRIKSDVSVVFIHKGEPEEVDPLVASQEVKVTRSFTAKPSLVKVNDVEREGYTYNLPFLTGNGLCGGVLLTHTTSPTIVGLHIAGYTGFTLGGCHKVTQDALKAACDAVVKRAGFSMQSAGTFPTVYAPGVLDIPQGVIPADEPQNDHRSVNFLTGDPQIFNYGDHVGGAVRFRTSVRTSVISEQVAEFMQIPREHWPPTEIAKRAKESGEPYHLRSHFQRDLDTMAHTAGGFNPYSLELAYNDLNCLFTQVQSEYDPDGSIIHPISHDAILAGADGVPGIEAIDLTTSMGHPFQMPTTGLSSKKKAYITTTNNPVIVDGTTAITCSRELDEAVQCDVDSFELDPQKDEATYMVFRAALKDEPVKPGKRKLRIFAGCSFKCLYHTRKYYLSIVRFIQKKWKHLECAVGINAFGMQWDELSNWLSGESDDEGFVRDRTFSGDYKAFDKNVPIEITQLAFKILIDIAKRANYDPDQIRLMEKLASEITNPFYEWEGLYVQVFGSNPSGHPLTVILNNIINSLYLRYVYYELKRENKVSNPPLFHKMVRLICYGDDNAGTVHPKEQHFTFDEIRRVLASVGVTYTREDKKDESQGFRDISDLSFLKRKFRFDDDLGCHVAPLEISSISKSLHNYTHRKGSVVLPSEIAAMSLQQAHREFFRHGRRVFETMRERMLLVIANCPEMELTTVDLPCWSEMVEIFHGRVEKAPDDVCVLSPVPMDMDLAPSLEW